MKVNLWQLNEGWQTLLAVASRELPKKHFKITYKLGRIIDAAKPHVERWGQKAAPELMAQFGIRRLPNGQMVSVLDEKVEATQDQIEKFNKAARVVMIEDVIDLIGEQWTPFQAKDILEVEPLKVNKDEVAFINGLEFGLLYGWLIVGEIPEEDEKKGEQE